MTRTIRSTVIRTAAIASALALALSACGSGDDDPAEGDATTDAATEEATDPAPAELQTLRVGALAVPAGQMLTWVEENLAADAGLEIEWVEFTDYNTPNPALTDGDIDANLFQHHAFLDTYNSQAGGDLVSVGEVYLPAAGFYSFTIESLDELEDGATITLPNDPSNESRALGLLAAEGLIEISEGATTLGEITDNPRGFVFQELENASLPQAVQDSDITFVTAAFALPAGLTAEQAVIQEADDSVYYNILATRPELVDDPAIVTLFELLNDDEFQAFVIEEWNGLIVPAP